MMTDGTFNIDPPSEEYQQKHPDWRTRQPDDPIWQQEAREHKRQRRDGKKANSDKARTDAKPQAQAPNPFLFAQRAYIELRERLDKNASGAVLGTHSNTMLILKEHPPLQDLFQYDAFSGNHLILRPVPPAHAGLAEAPGPYPRQWLDDDITDLLSYLQKTWSPSFKRATVKECVKSVGSKAAVHDVLSYLDTLTWDETPRIDTWMSHTFGCEDNEYHRAVSAKTVIAAVRRVRQPGCKFDHMVVIEGRQGIRKSTAIARLFGEKWFTDQISALGSKDAAVDLRGKWVIEVGEIDAIIKAEVETVKAFLSRSFDHYRPPYGEVAVDVPRQNIFIGTTNEHEYLRDTSGNRRFWPVRSNDQSVNIEWVSANRDQIWAEAAYREASGEPIWLDHADVQATAVAAQAERLTEDAWHPRIAAYVNAKAKAYDNGVKVNAVDGHMQSYPEGSRGRFVTTPELLEQCLNIPTAQQNRAAEMRAAGVLRTLGWDKKPEWDAKIAKTVRVWRQKGVVWSQKG